MRGNPSVPINGSSEENKQVCLPLQTDIWFDVSIRMQKRYSGVNLDINEMASDVVL